MADSTWETGRLISIWHPVGRRSDGAMRYRRARYDLLLWSPDGIVAADNYVVPTGITEVDPLEINLRDTGQTGMEFGYYTNGHIIVDFHEPDGRDDTWKSLHFFGPM